MTTVDPLFDPAVIEEPYEYYAELRELDPVHEVPGTGTYLVSRLSLIQEVIADPATYSSRPRLGRRLRRRLGGRKRYLSRAHKAI